MTLKVMRRPAQLAGLGELQAFLERGYAAFGAMRGRGGRVRLDRRRPRAGDLSGAVRRRRRGVAAAAGALRRRLFGGFPAQCVKRLESDSDGTSRFPLPTEARHADIPPRRFNLAWHCLGRQATERGGKTALIIADGPDAFRSWTYAELDGMVRRLAGGLDRKRPPEGRPGDDPRRQRHRFRPRLLRRHRDRLRRSAGLPDADRRRSAGAGRRLRARRRSFSATPSPRSERCSPIFGFSTGRRRSGSPPKPRPRITRRPARTIPPISSSPPARPPSPRACCTPTGW